jgi:hypothetical protein
MATRKLRIMKPRPEINPEPYKTELRYTYTRIIHQLLLSEHP